MFGVLPRGLHSLAAPTLKYPRVRNPWIGDSVCSPSYPAPEPGWEAGLSPDVIFGPRQCILCFIATALCVCVCDIALLGDFSPVLSGEFSVTWDCKVTCRREKPNLCPKFLVLASSSSLS